MNINKKFGGDANVDVSRLNTLLVNSKLATENQPLYQTILGLITGLNKTQEIVSGKFGTDGLFPTDQLKGIVDLKNGGTLSNIYLPVLVNIANVTTSAAYFTWWSRIGNLITVGGKVTIETTADDTLTQMRISLPFPSKFQAEEQLWGVASGTPFAGSTEGFSSLIKADVPEFSGLFEFFSTNTSNNDVRFMLTYLLIPK